MSEEITVQKVTRTATEVTPVETVPAHTPKTYAQKKAIFRAYQIIWYILGVIEFLLITRFLLRALAANSASGFANLIYTLSYPFAQPFRGIFPTPVAGGSVFEWSTVLAMVVYLILAYGIVFLFQLVKPTNPQEVETKVNNPSI